MSICLYIYLHVFIYIFACLQNQESAPSTNRTSVLSNIDSITPPVEYNRSESTGGSSGKERKDGRTKKKSSWFNSLYPTYKSRSEDFKRIFKEVPDEERLVVGRWVCSTYLMPQSYLISLLSLLLVQLSVTTTIR